MTVITGGYLERLNTLSDGSVKIIIATQEITPETAGMLFSIRGKYIKIALNEGNILPEVVEHIEELEIKEEGKKVKSKSQILRSMIYKNWELNTNQSTNSNDHYDEIMDKLIDHFQSKLPN